MKRKHAVAAIFCVAAIGFTWVSPYIAMYRISMAARSVRMAGLEQQADLAAVRASVRQQLQAGGHVHDAEELAAMVDTIVSPPGLTALIMRGKEGADGKRHDFGMAYRSWKQVVLRRDGGQDASQFVLQRHGVWDWKLIAVTLPAKLL
ncbi:DUF2939 domain-containing protein [Janthinobacterium sp. Mn2066]|uniref:DUF2939 domain-containing protein n=1 Tax=Janthinobacterium sp. Mn2066 TaxID=3395264 RepID=UPI003BC63B84